MFNVSDAAYDNFMGRYSVRLAPLFADFAGVAAGSRVLDVGAGTGALTAELVRRDADRRRRRSVAAVRRDAARSAFPASTRREAPAEELPWPDAVVRRRARAARDLVHGGRARRGRRDAARRQARRRRRSVHVGSRGHGDARTRSTGAGGRRSRAARPTCLDYRDAGSIKELLGDGAEVELLEVEAGYADFDEFWDDAHRRRRAGGRLGRVARRRPARAGTRRAAPDRSASRAAPSR